MLLSVKSIRDYAQECAELIQKSGNIAALTGAGISTKAGIPDFRGPQGLYVTRRYDPEIVFDIDYFYRDPKPFYEFARDFIALEETIQPTFTHRFLAQLESLGKLKGIVTQNIDALHQKAGSKKVYEMHGGISQAFCVDCNKKYSYEDIKKLLKIMEVPTCSCDGVIKPDVVFFGENVKHFDESAKLAGEADLFLVIGTSCVVQPAAQVPRYAKGKIVIVNLGEVDLAQNNITLSVQEDLDKFFELVSKKLEN